MDKKLIEYDVVIKLVDGDEEFLLELLNELIIQIDDCIKPIREAIKSSDYDSIKSLCHKLKGASANLSVNRTADYCRQLEDMVKKQNLDGAETLLEDIEKSKNDLDIYLKNL
ncbi:MAG: Hpt domain-containing protein [Calditrichales bacterium]|nr:Hpt domain-containing protein [Calditrichales bacterium]